MRHPGCAIVIVFLILASTPPANAEGLTPYAKDILTKNTNYDSREFIRQYLEFSDCYSSGECLEYGSRTNQGREAQYYCGLYFSKDRGLTGRAASCLRDKVSGTKFSPEFSNVLYNFLLSGKKYDVKSCLQHYQYDSREMKKEEQSRINRICNTFFRD